MPSSSSSPIARAAPEHRIKFASGLGGAQSAALRSLMTAGLLRPSIDDETKSALIAAGYARDALGGTALTDTGGFRAAMEMAA